MDQLWTQFIGFVAQFVSPDWGKVVSFLPVLILAVAGLYGLWLVRSLALLGPAERGGRPLPPRPPAGVHMPGPSLAPVFGAIGMALLVWGLVFRAILPIGLIVLVLALLYWLREGMRDYDHVEPTRVILPAVVHDGPPAGVHMPGPSFRPILAGISMMVIVFGLVFGWALLVAGFLMLAATLIGWLRDARTEYGLTVEADRTGHLRNAPSPHYPSGTLTFFAVVLIGAILVTFGIIPPGGTSGGSAAASGSPTASGATGSAQPSAVAADVTIVAKNIAYTTKKADAPAGRAFTIAFDNQDAGIPHNISIQTGTASNQQVFLGKIVTGPVVEIYDIPPLAAGIYTYICSVHATMTGVLTVK
jgi:plastocyanin